MNNCTPANPVLLSVLDMGNDGAIVTQSISRRTSLSIGVGLYDFDTNWQVSNILSVHRIHSHCLLYHVIVCFSMARVAHSGMAADEIAENIDSAVSTIVTKLRVVS